MRRLLIVSSAALGVLLAGALVAQQASDRQALQPVSQVGIFEVSDIDVDVSGRSPEQARQGGWREAQRKGWRILWGRMTNKPAESAPKLGDGALDAMVSGIVVQREEIGPNRYIARLGVTFDRARAGALLGTHGQIMRSPPELMLPIEITGDTRTAYEQVTDWAKAWARFRTGMSPIDYVRPTGTGPDALLLTAGQARRGDRDWWRGILDQYGAADVLVAEAYLDRAWPGGPVKGRFIARHGPDGEVLESFELRASSSAGLDAMLDEAVKRIDAIYGAALRSGRLRADPKLLFEDQVALPEIAPEVSPEMLSGVSAIQLQVDTPDAAALSAVEAAIRGAQGVTSQNIVTLALGGTSSLRIAYEGDVALLRWALDQRGWRIDLSSGGGRLRRRAAGEAALPKPEVQTLAPVTSAPPTPAGRSGGPQPLLPPGIGAQ